MQKINKFFPFIIGVIVTMFLIYFIMPSMMIRKQKSPYDFNTTVAKISEKIVKEGWSLMGVKRVDESIKKHGEKVVEKVALIELCHPAHAAAIIKDPRSTHISVMMPCTISVYETAEQDVYISTMNVKPMAWIFGGTVKRIMGGAVAEAQQKFIALE